MRKLYLLRHCEPELPEGRRVCLSAQDPPLSVLGRMRAALLAAALPPVTRVFCSPLRRARETAAAIAGESVVLGALRELGMGCWDGLSFDAIRARWPELYERRGAAPFDCFPKGAEAPAECLARMRSAVGDCLETSEGDIAVLAHAGANRLLLCALMGREMNGFLSIPQPYGCMSTLSFDGERLRVEKLAAAPDPTLTPELCEALLAAAETPESVRAHGRAVARRAEELAAALTAGGYELDLPLLRSAALLHDLARSEPGHERVGAERLRALGYAKVSELIAAHHNLPPAWEAEPNEGAVLYLADKQVRGTARVTVEERFAESGARCVTAEAKEKHTRRLLQARRVEKMIEQAAFGDAKGENGDT